MCKFFIQTLVPYSPFFEDTLCYCPLQIFSKNYSIVNFTKKWTLIGNNNNTGDTRVKANYQQEIQLLKKGLLQIRINFMEWAE